MKPGGTSTSYLSPLVKICSTYTTTSHLSISKEYTMSQLPAEGEYSMHFWSTTKNDGVFGGDDAAATCLAFVKKLQTESTEDRLFLPSAPKEHDSSVHIALFLPTSLATKECLEAVTKRLNQNPSEFPGHSEFVLSSDVRSRKFSAEEVSNIRESAKAFPGANAPVGSKDQIALSKGWLERLKRAKGEVIEAEMKAMAATINVEEAHSAWKSIVLAASGIVVVVPALSDAIGISYTVYTAIQWMASLSVSIAVSVWATVGMTLAVLGGIFLGAHFSLFLIRRSRLLTSTIVQQSRRLSKAQRTFSLWSMTQLPTCRMSRSISSMESERQSPQLCGLPCALADMSLRASTYTRRRIVHYMDRYLDWISRSREGRHSLLEWTAHLLFSEALTVFEFSVVLVQAKQRS